MFKTKDRIILSSLIAILGCSLILGIMLDKDRVISPEDYRYRFGRIELFSTYTHADYLKDSYYYSDDWFLSDASVRNDGLALASMQLTAASVEAENSRGIAFLKDAGFEETGLAGFDSNDRDGFNYTWGTKTIGRGFDKYKLVAVTIQSYSLDRDVRREGWKQNFMVNGPEKSDEHYAFAKAVDKMVDGIVELGGSGRVKYWISGHSRGGALANILAARLNERVNKSGNRIYAYTFEAPGTVNAQAVSDSSKYGYIHNYRTGDDIVCLVPPWDMTLYGQIHMLGTDDVKTGLAGGLKELGSEACQEAEGADEESLSHDKASDIVAVLSDKIATREDYSAQKTDTFTDASGNEVTVSYVYQDIFVKAMDVIFGDEEIKADSDAVAGKMNDIADIGILVKNGEQNGSCADTLEAARELGKLLDELGIKRMFEENEMYAILKLAGPVMFDMDFEKSGEESENMGVIAPAMSLIGNIRLFVISHQFETSVVRLRNLASDMPVLASFDVKSVAPAAGASVTSASDGFAAAAVLNDTAGKSYVSGSAQFLTQDHVFSDNKVYYMRYSLRSIGHRIPSDLDLTINGASSVVPLDISRSDGVCTITGIWRFAVGSPSGVSVSFDNGGYETAPGPVTVARGSILRYELEPETYGMIEKDGCRFNFGGWFDAGGTGWEDVCADEDTVLTAKWNKLIERVEFSIDLPGIGEEFSAPVVPEGCGYSINEISYLDSSWNDVDKIGSEGKYIYSFVITLDEGYEAYGETNEAGDFNYLGTYAINGEEREVDYDIFNASYDITVSQFYIEYYFTVSSSGTEGENEGAGHKIGDEIVMGKYSGEDIVWTVKDKDDDGLLLVSKYVIDAKSFNDEFKPVKWEDCSLRKWLNSEFIDGCFTEEEQDMIVTSKLVNNDNPINGIDGGNDTEDKVFLLSIDEAYKYFETDKDRQALPTEYAASQKVMTEEDGYSYWRLRSPGKMGNYSAFVYVRGMVNESGFEVHYKYYGLRPAMRIRE